MDEQTSASERSADESADSGSSEHAAAERDLAASARDDAAEARDEASVDAGEARRTSDRQLSTRDRAATAPDRQEAALRAAAALARDETAAEARDAASEIGSEAQDAAEDRQLTAEDRAAAADDRRHAALDRSASETSLEKAYHDQLTGTLARDAGDEQLRQAVDRAQRLEESLVLAILDVDNLKRVNDTKGYAYGDRLLHEVGAALRQGLRSYDIVVRYGGDEFACALAGVGLPEAHARFTEVSELLTKAIDGASFSAGLAELRTGETAEELIARADTQMYADRTAKRNAQLSSGD